jgi:hypothetical protein
MIPDNRHDRRMLLPESLVPRLDSKRLAMAANWQGQDLLDVSG